MASVTAHPAVALARGTLRASSRPRLRPLRASGPLGAGFDPFSAEAIADPAAVYRRLHARPGVHPAGRSTFALAGYEEVRAAARAHAELVSRDGVTQVRSALPMLLTIDRPRHGQLRRLVAPMFTAARIELLQATMRELVSDALDRMIAGRAGIDAVSSLAVPLPITVIARMLGVPEADVGHLHELSDGIVEGFHCSSLRSLPSGLRSGRSTLALHRYLGGVLARLRARPGDDILSALLATGDLSDEELFWFSLLLLVAGNETTTNLIGWVLLALARDPAAYALLRSDPGLIGSAIEEAVRWGSPIQSMFRTVAADYPVGPVTLPAGSRVLLMFAAANRDPRKYPDPDRYVITRSPSDHLGFGAGIHFCLGAHLARLEARVVLEELIARVGRLEPAGQVSFQHNPAVRGPSRLPLRLVPG